MARDEFSAKLLAARIQKGEGQKTEFKESTGLEDEIAESLGAFAHSRGGLVLVGVRDDKKIVGQQVGANTLEKLANAIVRRTQPALSPRIEEVTISDRIIVAISIDPIAPNRLVYACNRPLIRVGRTNQLMSPASVEARLFAGFRAENSPETPRQKTTQSWQEREERRKKRYESQRGLFITHEWRPSTQDGQDVDIIASIRQHPGADQPMTDGHVKSVEWHLGPKFFDRTVVKTEVDEGFKLEISAYGPVLCIAYVNFDDGSEPVELERYLDF